MSRLCGSRGCRNVASRTYTQASNDIRGTLEGLRKALHIFYELADERDETYARWCRDFHSELWAEDDTVREASYLLEDLTNLVQELRDRDCIPDDLGREVWHLMKVAEGAGYGE